ncbi:hypothetical protein GOODEAATRI_000347 [Goodea atripinnis]|uniref:Uncharacterized protein n=1 Tax=Goodea atripinnis TaxID=208336 RepID=A0ABV0MXL4_9TELE
MASLDEELTCSVCRDSFSQAHPLPCGHSFCPACIREALSPHGEGKGRFTCPQCQEEHGEVLCDCCPIPVEDGHPPMAVKTCLRCEVSLCADHLRPHLERPAFSTHLLVEPLGDLSQRRCSAHSEVFRYYCVDERMYVCGDCLLEGGHALHKVKPLKQVEEDLKVQVKRLVVALKEITKRERQQIMERVHQDCAKVRDDMSQTVNIQHYLNLLLAETDPFLLIWVRLFQLLCTAMGIGLLADLNCPLYLPEPICMDRKHILEDIESKYREFITATLRCLTELKRELLTSPLSLDTNSAHPLLSISDDLRSVTRVKSRLPCAAHPERFDHWPQVLTVQTFSSGTHYWELEAEGFWDVAVCYRSIGRKGKEGNAFGNNKVNKWAGKARAVRFCTFLNSVLCWSVTCGAVSWSLTQQHNRKLSAWHNRRKTRLTYQMVGNRVAVAVDYSSGTITFSEVGPSNSLIHLHTFSTSFTQPVCVGFGLYKAELKSRISVIKV